MKIAGVIAEYNPFHAGHAYHLSRTRARTGCDFIVVCMAGSFVQRGEAACLSKWARAEMALRCGADAVVELPALFAVRPADAFAMGGVGTLDGLGVDVLSFGSEDAGLPRRLAELRRDEPPELAERVRKNLAAGMSHARAWGAAAAESLGVDPGRIGAPNTILGAEYLRAIGLLQSGMEVEIVPRAGDYHDASLPDAPSADAPRDPSRADEPSGETIFAGNVRFASATAIRAALREGRRSEALACVPAEARAILAHAGAMHEPDDLLLARLRGMSGAEITGLPDVAEGLERRILRCAAGAPTREALLDALKCKRYTRARLSRILAHAMLGMTGALVRRHPRPEYVRLIGMREDARPLMRELSRRARLPLFSSPAKLAESEIFDLECRATDLRALMCDAAEERRAGQEFTQKFVRL